MKYRKRPIVIEATQWFKNGDHPEDKCNLITSRNAGTFLSEGKVVRHYRHPDDSSNRMCGHCLKTTHYHGWIDTLEGGHIVCPGDWIITGVEDERYPCKDNVFKKTYEEVKDA